jgi:hypothetical protein
VSRPDRSVDTPQARALCGVCLERTKCRTAFGLEQPSVAQAAVKRVVRLGVQLSCVDAGNPQRVTQDAAYFPQGAWMRSMLISFLALVPP